MVRETRYLISETAKLLQVESHVLRYWEEELGLVIKRNEMGHRYYTDKDLQIFQKIIEMKNQGMQLKTIREKIHEEDQDNPREENLQQRKPEVCVKIITPKKLLKKEVSKEEQFQKIMERLIREIELAEKKEGRYRRLDEAIRKHQQSRKLVAATQENRRKKKTV